MLWLRYWALPNVDHYRDDIVSSIEKASGMAVTTRAMSGGWDGLRPSISLEGFAINDRRGKVALGFERAEVTLSWWALLAGQVRFNDVDFYRPALALRRGADGLIYLGDKPLNEAGPDDGAFTEWLLAQPRLGIHDATLAWRDEKGGAPEVRLTGLRGDRGEETSRPPSRRADRGAAARARRAHRPARRREALAREANRWLADGDAYGETRNADLGKLRAHLPVPETLRQRRGQPARLGALQRPTV